MTIPSYNPDHGNNNYGYVPNDTQAIAFGQYQQTNVKNVPAIKKLHTIMWASAAAYVLIYISNIIFALNSAQQMGVENEGVYSTTAVITAVVFILVGLGLYFLVYSLINKGKNGGRITGTVFAGLSVTGLLTGILNFIGGAPLSGVFYIIWAILGIVWLVFAWKKDVTEALTPRNPYMH